MKLKEYLEKEYSYEFFINKHFWVSIIKVRKNIQEGGDKQYYYYIEYCSSATLDYEDFDYEIKGIKLSGEETLGQVVRLIKRYYSSDKKISNSKLIKSTYNEFNISEYSMTLKNTKNFINAMKKEFGIGNDFIHNEMGIYGLTNCAMYLGY